MPWKSPIPGRRARTLALLTVIRGVRQSDFVGAGLRVRGVSACVLRFGIAYVTPSSDARLEPAYGGHIGAIRGAP